MKSIKLINSSQAMTKPVDELLKEIPRFNYRSGFSPINPGNYTSDRGWGCCYRSSQGLLAQYVLHLKEYSPETYTSVFGTDMDPLSLFIDDPKALFGIHNLVRHAELIGVKPGQWAKPSVAAATIKSIMDEIGLGCIVSRDFTIEASVLENVRYPVLLLIPGLFGLKKIDESFLPFLQLCVCANGALGFVSGYNNSAYYICGFDAENFAYFDPHVTAAAVTKAPYDFFSLPIRLIKYGAINPSVLLGFACAERSSLEEILMILMACSSSPISVIDQSILEDAVNQVLDIDELDVM